VNHDLDDLVAIIDWMRKVEGKSWQQVANALGERVGFVQHVCAERGLNTYKRVRRLKKRAQVYASRRLTRNPIKN